MKEKVIIIGGGVAGLSAGIYAALNGFETTILEQHTLAGGNCTAWHRKGYYFEGGLHWLSGATKEAPTYNMWRELAVLADDVKVYAPETYCCYLDKNNTPIYLHKDLTKLEACLKAISPQDEKFIKKFCKSVKAYGAMKPPTPNAPKVKMEQKAKGAFSFKMLAAIKEFPKLSKITVNEYVQDVSHPSLKSLIGSGTPGNYPAYTALFYFAQKASSDGVYLEGGSLAMIERMVQRFTSLGGKVKYRQHVEKVVINQDKVDTILLKNGEQVTGDYFIIASDTKMALTNFFDEPLKAKWIPTVEKLRPSTGTFISVAVEADLSNYPEMVLFDVDQPIEIAKQAYQQVGFHNYANFKDYAPEGCTSITMNFLDVAETQYTYWEAAKNDGSYKDKKREIAEKVEALLIAKFPEWVGKVRVLDVATPLTYMRYCGTYHGGWMSIVDPGMRMKTMSGLVDGVPNLFFAGQRLTPPGGLPIAAATGRTAVQYLCNETNKVFKGA